MNAGLRRAHAGAVIVAGITIVAMTVHGQVRQTKLCGPLSAAQRQVVPTRTVPLWPPATLGVADGPDAPHVDLYVAPQNPTRTAVLLFPGGGYGCIAQANEGIPVAQWLVAHGISAVVVTYRIAPDHYPAPLEDGRRAMQWARFHAAELNAAPNHIGVMGFSAGGHQAAFVAVTAQDGVPAGWLDLPDFKEVKSAPDFLILGYPVITMNEATHPGSRMNLLGPQVENKPLRDALSAEQRVTGQAPPTFIFQTTDDDVVPVSNSLKLYQAMVAARVPVEMHLYQHGPHGMGLAQDDAEVGSWPQLLANWMVFHGWMDNGQARPK